MLTSFCRCACARQAQIDASGAFANLSDEMVAEVFDWLDVRLARLAHHRRAHCVCVRGRATLTARRRARSWGAVLFVVRRFRPLVEWRKRARGSRASPRCEPTQPLIALSDHLPSLRTLSQDIQLLDSKAMRGKWLAPGQMPQRTRAFYKDSFKSFKKRERDVRLFVIFVSSSFFTLSCVAQVMRADRLNKLETEKYSTKTIVKVDRFLPSFSLSSYSFFVVARV